MEAKLKALDPRGHFNVVQRAALSPRPDTMAGKTVYIINSWPGDTHGFGNVEMSLRTILSASGGNTPG